MAKDGQKVEAKVKVLVSFVISIDIGLKAAQSMRLKIAESAVKRVISPPDAPRLQERKLLSGG